MSRPRIGRCPGCAKERDVDAQRGLREVELTWFAWDASRGGQPVRDGMRTLATERDRSDWFWACDVCLKNRGAIRANVTRVTICMGTPFAAYVDRDFRCEDCRAESVFSASEQLHWFETLGFLIWVYPKQCPACRRKRRRLKTAQQALADALHGLDPEDPKQLDAVARLYEETGASRKAAELRARARNRQRS